MDSRALQRIEATLGVRLPGDYRRAMTDGEAAANQDFWQDGLYNDPAVIIDRTNGLRGLMEDAGAALRLSQIVVTEVNGGDYVVLDVSAHGQPLLLWDHETNQLHPFLEGIDSFVNGYRAAP